VPDTVHVDEASSQRWVLRLTVALLFAAAVLRSLLVFEGGQLALVLVLMTAWLALLIAEPPLSGRWPAYFALYVTLSAAIVLVLIGLSDDSDYFGLLLAIPGMQAMERWRSKEAFVLIAVLAVLTGIGLLPENGAAEAVSLAVIYAALAVFLGSYALTARRAREARVRNEVVAADVREANQRLAESARQAERLAGARERQRLARDLHDSVTQTLFSMTLSARSAALLLERQPAGLAAQLDQIEQLGLSAKAELRELSAELFSSPVSAGGLVASLRRHVAERAEQDGLTVDLQVSGDRRLPQTDEEALLRIVQEALNNVAKHAGVAEAEVRVRLERPASVEIVDRGRGFGWRDDDVGAPGSVSGDEPPGHGAGLGIMRERAVEIGWRLTVASAPDGGTCVVAEEVQGVHVGSGEGGGDRD
jgi:signal transduction histidine kinase